MFYKFNNQNQSGFIFCYVKSATSVLLLYGCSRSIEIINEILKQRRLVKIIFFVIKHKVSTFLSVCWYTDFYSTTSSAW